MLFVTFDVYASNDPVFRSTTTRRVKSGIVKNEPAAGTLVPSENPGRSSLVSPLPMTVSPADTPTMFIFVPAALVPKFVMSNTSVVPVPDIATTRSSVSPDAPENAGEVTLPTPCAL